MLSGIATIANPELIGPNSLDLDNVTFLHRTLAECFAAKFIVSKLKSSKVRPNLLIFLQRNIFLEKYDLVRYFLDHLIISQMSPSFQSALSLPEDETEKGAH